MLTSRCLPASPLSEPAAPAAAAAEPAAAAVAMELWEFQEGNTWTRYEDSVQANIRAAKAANQPEVAVSQIPHILNFAQSRQYDQRDRNRWRSVRVVDEHGLPVPITVANPTALGSAPPDNWDGRYAATGTDEAPVGAPLCSNPTCAQDNGKSPPVHRPSWDGKSNSFCSKACQRARHHAQ